MIFKFSVIRTLDCPDAVLHVCGSLPELGAWTVDRAIALQRSGDFQHNEPSFWSCDIELCSKSRSQPFEFKYLTRYNDGRYEWEGCGERTNRRCDPEVETNIEDDVYYLAPVHWIDTSGLTTNERQHTTNFYFRVIADHQGIHYTKINDRIYLGSCPRQFFHLAMLKSLGVSAVVNLQTSSDMFQNSRALATSSIIDNEQKAVEEIIKLYQQQGVAFVWLPTPDMSTEGRIRAIPQGVFLLHALIQNGHRVYVYCNAGVGRSVAIVCAYFLYVKNMKFRQMEYFLCSKRPAVYIDEEALRVARDDYEKKYGFISKAISAIKAEEFNGLSEFDD